MRNPDRIDNFLRLVGEKWKQQGTDLRFTQFLLNNGFDDMDILYHIEEEEFLKALGCDPREFLYWGSWGKSRTDPLKWILIKDLTTDHLEAILANVPKIDPLYKDTMKKELKRRKK